MQRRITTKLFPALTLLVILLGLLMVPVFTGSTQDAGEADGLPRDPETELEVLTELNRWRVRRGLFPLQRNTLLDELALEQAQFVSDRIPFTQAKVDFHTDRFGDGVAPRAEIAGWTPYGLSQAFLIAEIAAYYPNVRGVIGFWQNSPVHNASATNPGYREVGISVLRNGNWILAYAVLGGRPNILPVTYNARNNALYLSRDDSTFTEGLFQPTQVQILNAYGERLHDPEWIVWSEQIPLPANATDLLTVIVSDGIIDIETIVDINQARIYPAEPIPQPTPTLTPYPTRTAPAFTATPLPPTARPTATPAPRNDEIGYDVVLQYNNNGLTFINTSGGPLDITPLALVSRTLGQTFTGRFMGRYAKEPLTAIPANHCLQMWSFSLSQNPPPLPAQCDLLASGRSILRPGERFWLAHEFVVTYNRAIIATCHAEALTCAFDLPQSEE